MKLNEENVVKRCFPRRRGREEAGTAFAQHGPMAHLKLERVDRSGEGQDKPKEGRRGLSILHIARA